MTTTVRVTIHRTMILISGCPDGHEDCHHASCSACSWVAVAGSDYTIRTLAQQHEAATA